MVEQQERDFAHGNCEDEEPTQARDEEKCWCQDAVEVDEEDDPAKIPFSTTEQPALSPRCICVDDVRPAVSPKQTCCLATVRVNAIAPPANK